MVLARALEVLKEHCITYGSVASTNVLEEEEANRDFEVVVGFLLGCGGDKEL